MKKFFISFFVILTMTGFSINAINLANTKYIGIITKFPNIPVDLWATLNFGEKGVDMNLADLARNDAESYKVTTLKSGTTVNFLLGGKFNTTLKTTDNGASFSGKMNMTSIKGGMPELWLLRVPNKEIPVELSDDALTQIFESEDGYTVFFQVPSDDMLACIVCDLIINKTTKRWSLKCDDKVFQKFMDHMKGGYEITNGKLIFSFDPELQVSDKTLGVYDDGKYMVLNIPSRGMNATIYFIR